ncbi:kinase-like domain-containing protein [Mycena floridula]|nr:kinase-like domain-containing protein [Mycena floridula]
MRLPLVQDLQLTAQVFAPSLFDLIDKFFKVNVPCCSLIDVAIDDDRVEAPPSPTVVSAEDFPVKASVVAPNLNLKVAQEISPAWLNNGTFRDMIRNRELNPKKSLPWSLLGQGALGVVYKAFDPESNIQVAYKRTNCSEESCDEIEALYPVIGEPCCASVYGAWINEVTRPGKAFYKDIIVAMKCYPNGDLGAFVKKHKPSHRLVVFWTAQLVCFCPWAFYLSNTASAPWASEALHSHAVIHRDLKPTNILVDEEFGHRGLGLAGVFFQKDEQGLQESMTNRASFGQHYCFANSRLVTPTY